MAVLLRSQESFCRRPRPLAVSQHHVRKGQVKGHQNELYNVMNNVHNKQYSKGLRVRACSYGGIDHLMYLSMNLRWNSDRIVSLMKCFSCKTETEHRIKYNNIMVVPS